MASKKKMEITKPQLNAIVNATDIISAMIGSGDEDTDKEFQKTVKSIDKFLNINGISRKRN